jgi:hypothetical protein
MNKKFLILISLMALFTMAAVSGQNNDSVVGSSVVDELNANVYDEKLEETYFYDADADEEYADDTVVTHDVVKYYGDTDTKFNVKVYDDDYYPESGVYVSFGKAWENSKEKRTNAKGMVSFPINYKVGSHYVETRIDAEDGKSYWTAYNTVKIKSTIPTKELVKQSNSKKKFKIKFLDTKGHKLKNKVVKLKIKGKTYKLKTNGKGIVKINSEQFKSGKYKITAYNLVSGEVRKISVVVLKKGHHIVNIRVDDPTDYFPTKKLSNGDRISTVYETQYRQYNPGVYVQAFHSGMDLPKHTKLLKAKFYFKNKINGKIITKTSRKVSYDTIKVKPKGL